jgi:hypothetical protein
VQVKLDARIGYTSLIRDGRGGEAWRGGCEWCVVSVVVVVVGGGWGTGFFWYRTLTATAID